jgi:hypothetical protein
MNVRLPGHATACALLALCLSTCARAELKPCQSVRAPAFTVYLSEPAFTREAFKTPDDLDAFMTRLHRQLDDGRDRRWLNASTTDVDVRFVRCPGRVPSLDGEDFRPDIVETMRGQGVLLEVWGSLDARTAADGTRLPSADMRFLLVPVRFAADRNETAAPPLPRLDYVAAAFSAAPDFAALITAQREVDAFVATALGFKLLRERRYELAHRNLCLAGALLKKIEKRLPPGRDRDVVVSLQSFAQAAATSAIQGVVAQPPAGAPPGTRSSLLTLQNPKEPCGQELEP